MSHFFDKTDLELKQDVINELMADSSVNSKHIKVETHEGIVTLYGTVPHYFQKATAATVTQHVQGVRAVADELDVSLSNHRSDQQIARSVLRVFRWSLSIPSQVKVKVEKGWVTLSGEADWDFQRVATRNAISQLEGVCGVTNDIQLRSSVQSEDIRERIEASLKRSTITDSHHITVVAEGGRVTLSGRCHSVSELGDATMAAWTTRGVTHVKNLMRVSA